jgi:hypothetical protein
MRWSGSWPVCASVHNMHEQAVRYVPVIRRKSPRVTLYDFGRVVPSEADPICPVCGADVLLLAFDDLGMAMVFPYDPAPEDWGETGHAHFDDLLPRPHAWTCRRDHPEDW